MKWDDPEHASPCAKCPYRKDAPLRLWHADHFRKLLKDDADPERGSVYCCHNDGKRALEDRRPCVGWLLNQRQRGTPSLQLRMALIASKTAAAAYERINSAGLNLYRSIQAMCRANGVRSDAAPALSHEDLKLVRMRAWIQGGDPDAAEREALKSSRGRR